MTAKVTHCSEPTCRLEIVFLRTSTGALMPIDAATVGPDDVVYDSSKHTSHYKTCKKPNKFTRGKR